MMGAVIICPIDPIPIVVSIHYRIRIVDVCPIIDIAIWPFTGFYHGHHIAIAVAVSVQVPFPWSTRVVCANFLHRGIPVITVCAIFNVPFRFFTCLNTRCWIANSVSVGIHKPGIKLARSGWASIVNPGIVIIAVCAVRHVTSRLLTGIYTGQWIAESIAISVRIPGYLQAGRSSAGIMQGGICVITISTGFIKAGKITGRLLAGHQRGGRVHIAVPISIRVPALGSQDIGIRVITIGALGDIPLRLDAVADSDSRIAKSIPILILKPGEPFHIFRALFLNWFLARLRGYVYLNTPTNEQHTQEANNGYQSRDDV